MRLAPRVSRRLKTRQRAQCARQRDRGVLFLEVVCAQPRARRVGAIRLNKTVSTFVASKRTIARTKLNNLIRNCAYQNGHSYRIGRVNHSQIKRLFLFFGEPRLEGFKIKQTQNLVKHGKTVKSAPPAKTSGKHGEIAQNTQTHRDNVRNANENLDS